MSDLVLHTSNNGRTQLEIAEHSVDKDFLTTAASGKSHNIAHHDLVPNGARTFLSAKQKANAGWKTRAPFLETDKALKQIVEKIGV